MRSPTKSGWLIRSTLNNAHTFWSSGRDAERESIEISLFYPLGRRTVNGSCVFATRLEYRVKLLSEFGAAHL